MVANDSHGPVFCLPDGEALGGVSLWSRRLAAQLPGSRVLVHGEGYWNPSRASLEAAVTRYGAGGAAVFVPNWSRGTYGACAALARQDPGSVRLIGFCHADESHYYRLLHYYEPLIHRFIAVSPRIAQGLRERLPQRSQDIVLRNYPLNFAPTAPRPYSGGPLRLISVGRIEFRQKRVFDLLTLARRLVRAAVDFQLTIVGDGPDRRPFGKMLEKLPEGVRSRIRWRGESDPAAVAQSLRASHLFVQMSSFEGTSMALAEAMSQGCAPVVTRVSGAETLIRSGWNGEHFEAGDTAAAAAHVTALAANPRRLSRLRAEAHRSSAEWERWGSYTAWFQSLVREVADEPPREWPTHRSVVPSRGVQWGLDLTEKAIAGSRSLTWSVGLRLPLRS